MRLRLFFQYLRRREAVRFLCLAIYIGNVILEFAHNPPGLVRPQPDLVALFSEMLPLLTLFIKPLISSIPAWIVLGWVIPTLATRFIHGLYNTQDLSEARSVLKRNLFGMTGLRPLMIVRGGDFVLGAGTVTDLIGGPALLVVNTDCAVVLEKGGRLTRVIGPGLRLIERFERVWEIVDLRPQRWVFPVSAMTKEGIPITCEADITFKIDDRFLDKDGNVRVKSPVQGHVSPIDDETIEAALEEGVKIPYPYTDEAVFKAATSIWVRIRQRDHQEQLRKWTGRVMIGNVEGALRTILYDYWLDDLMQPEDPSRRHPRDVIQERLEQKLQDSLPVGNSIGARILKVELGQIDVDARTKEGDEKRVSMQWVEAWQAVGRQRVAERLADGEAALARLQAEQVLAQAEMALALIDAVRPFSVGDVETFSSYELATHFVETLWWLSYSPRIQAFLPPTAIQTLEDLKKMLENKGGAALPAPSSDSLDQQ